MAETATRTRPEAGTTCPTCGASAETGQLICLECGSRIALAYRRPPSWRVPFVLVSLVVLAAAAGIYFGVQALEDDAKTEVAAQPQPSESESDQGGGSGSGGEDASEEDGAKSGDEDKAAEEKAEKEPAEDKKKKAAPEDTAAAPTTGAGGVASWPKGEDAYTVVILSAEDRPSARAFAQSAIKAGTDAGVLRADDYPSLAASTGFFLVFVGSYSNQVKADQAAARLGQRFKGAYPQFVDGSKAKG